MKFIKKWQERRELKARHNQFLEFIYSQNFHKVYSRSIMYCKCIRNCCIYVLKPADSDIVTMYLTVYNGVGGNDDGLTVLEDEVTLDDFEGKLQQYKDEASKYVSKYNEFCKRQQQLKEEFWGVSKSKEPFSDSEDDIMVIGMPSLM